ncbi:hypothetical protein HYPDE_25583 [Hyphomicrobium denitrificans 1NES1]|uniref:Uncharacterized protein n=1 Tax=Hyphomicrobium denitrificans 1NES1 TaxID=670307 RepID=N0B8C3_9HYPH|nr:hypothetical protein HYPDE_25583 [Hyphomicrobium denitrificans 1NES1]
MDRRHQIAPAQAVEPRKLTRFQGQPRRYHSGVTFQADRGDTLLAPLPPDLEIPMQGPTRPSRPAGVGKGERGKEDPQKGGNQRDAGMGLGSAMTLGGGVGLGVGKGDSDEDPLPPNHQS